MLFTPKVPTKSPSIIYPLVVVFFLTQLYKMQGEGGKFLSSIITNVIVGIMAADKQPSVHWVHLQVLTFEIVKIED